MNSKTILEQLKERKENRPGDFREWKFNYGKEIIGKVWIQPPTANEIDIAKVQAEQYVRSVLRAGNFQDYESLNALFADVVHSAIFQKCIFELDKKTPVFPTLEDARQFLTNEEIFYLKQILDNLTISLSPSFYLEEQKALEIAEIYFKEKDDSILENLHFFQLKKIIEMQQKRIEELNNKTA